MFSSSRTSPRGASPTGKNLAKRTWGARRAAAAVMPYQWPRRNFVVPVRVQASHVPIRALGMIRKPRSWERLLWEAFLVPSYYCNSIPPRLEVTSPHLPRRDDFFSFTAPRACCPLRLLVGVSSFYLWCCCCGTSSIAAYSIVKLRAFDSNVLWVGPAQSSPLPAHFWYNKLRLS